MQLYFDRHDGSAAPCDDLVQAMEDASNVDLSQFRCWYSQSGTPVLTVRDDYNPELEQYTLHVTQNTPATADQKEKLPLHVADAFRAVLLDTDCDPALTALILTLPSENEIAELFDVIYTDRRRLRWYVMRCWRPTTSAGIRMVW